MRFSLILSALTGVLATSATASSTWMCDFGADGRASTYVQLIFTTGHDLPGAPLSGDKVTILRASRDLSVDSEVIGEVSTESVVGYWNDEKSLKIRAVGVLPSKRDEVIDVLRIEATRVSLTESERESAIEYAYKLDTDMFYRLVNPKNQSVTRNMRTKGTRITCSRD